jgi:hypothetical protein
MGSDHRAPTEVTSVPASEDWKSVAESMNGLAMKLKLHFEQAAAEPAEDVRSAMESLGGKVEAAFDALQTAVKDPAVRADVKNAAGEFRDALTNTFAEVSGQLRRSFDPKKPD